MSPFVTAALYSSTWRLAQGSIAEAWQACDWAGLGGREAVGSAATTSVHGQLLGGEQNVPAHATREGRCWSNTPCPMCQRSEERYCRFCNLELKDWKIALTPGNMQPVQPVRKLWGRHGVMRTHLQGGG